MNRKSPVVLDGGMVELRVFGSTRQRFPVVTRPRSESQHRLGYVSILEDLRGQKIKLQKDHSRHHARIY